MKGDFTRSTFRPKKHYRQVNHQQGRVGLDADWNEQAEITAYRSETEALDVVGRAGAPKHDAGFGVDGTGAPSGDFKIGAGRFYVDGILCENDAEILFTKQPDLPGTTPLTTPGRYAVYLDVWQRHLTALDDPEIREVALGGPDTATRTKTIWQVRTGSIEEHMTCASKPAPWKVESDGRLRARAQPDAQSDEPCIVPPGAGYRRLENQLYRVEIHRAGPWWDESLAGPNVRLVAPATFKWSRDNGFITALIGSIGPNTITLTAARKDPVVGFAPGHWIEIIDAGNELRGEPGTLVRIAAVDDLVLTVDLTTVVGTFPSTLDLALLPKVRRWDSVGEVIVTAPSTNDGFIPLEDGVEVKFERGSYDTGDYWMIPARTDLGRVEWLQVPGSSPSVPEAQRPLGIQHHFCCLAIIEVTTGGEITLKEDCRRLFPPLTELEDACGCCTKTVGQTGEADYRFIQEAVDSLPTAGGQICVLPGTYEESVEIIGKENIIIIGCGKRSVLAPAVPETGPIIQIKDSSNIRLENLSFLQVKYGAIQVLSSGQVTSSQVAIVECEISMGQPNTTEPAIFFQADDGLIERNFISAVVVTPLPQPTSPNAAAAARIPPPAASPAHLASGIQLAGGCHRVRVLENLITNVRGQGLTFGHLGEVSNSVSSPSTATTPNTLAAKTIIGRFVNPDDRCDDCKGISNQVPVHPSQNTALPTHEIISPKSLWDIHIERNRIESTGLDGIGVIGFFDLSKQDQFITVRGLTILGNEIKGCLTLAREPIAPSMADSMGYGGIALADVYELVIHDNVIEGNGTQRNQPVCGIYVLHAQGIDIERNRILGNGFASSPPENAPPSVGPRGGVIIGFALAPVGPSAVATFFLDPGDPLGIKQTPSRPGEPTGFPALKCCDNIVSAPEGAALSAVALGPVSVAGNQLTSGRVTLGEGSSVYTPATVFIINLGVSNEAYSQQINFSNLRDQPFEPVLGLDDRRLGDRLANGKVLFTDNQCSLDLLEPGRSALFTSIALSSLDDIGFLNNQCDCNLAFNEDFVFAHAIVVGSSVRVMGNRFTEGWLNAAYSAVTAAVVNTTVHNQSTHCLWITGDPTLTTKDPNSILLKILCGETLAATVSNAAAMRNQQSNS
jgi:Family of unknown function (DUF6519)